MRKRQFKKVLSLVLALAMVFSMNTSVFATPADNPAPAVEETQNEATPETPVTNETETPAPAEEAAPAAEAPAADETPAPAAEEPKAEEPAAEAPKTEEPAAEAPKAEETPAPAAEAPKAEEAAGEAVALTGWVLTKDGTNPIDEADLTFDGTEYTVPNAKTVEFALGAGESPASGFILNVVGTAKFTGKTNTDVFARAEEGGTSQYFTTQDTLAAGKYKIFVVKEATLDQKKAMISWNDVTTKADQADAVVDTAALDNPVKKDAEDGKVDLIGLVSKKVMLSSNNTYVYAGLPAIAAAPDANTVTAHAAIEHVTTGDSFWFKSTAAYEYKISENATAGSARFEDLEISGNVAAGEEAQATDLKDNTKYAVFFRTACNEGTAWPSQWQITTDDSFKTVLVLTKDDFKFTVTGKNVKLANSERLGGQYIVVSENNVIAGDVKNEALIQMNADGKTVADVTKDANNKDLKYGTTYKVYVTNSTHSSVTLVEGLTFTTGPDPLAINWVKTDAISASVDGFTKNIDVYTSQTSSNIVLLSSNGTDDFADKIVTVIAPGKTIETLYTYDKRDNATFASKVILSGNNVTFKAAGFNPFVDNDSDRETALNRVKMTGATDLVVKTAGAYAVSAKADDKAFAANTTVFEAVPNLVSISFDDITIDVAEDLEVVAAVAGFKKAQTLSAGNIDVYENAKIVVSTPVDVIAVSKADETQFTTFKMYPLGKQITAPTLVLNTLSADGFQWEGLTGTQKYALSLSNDLAAFREADWGRVSTNAVRTENDLNYNTTYYVLGLTPAVVGTSFANFVASDAITTGDFYTISLTPEFKNPGMNFNATIEAEDTFTGSMFSVKAEEIDSEGNKYEIDDPDKTDLIGSAFSYYVDNKPVTMDTTKAPAKTGSYVVSMGEVEVRDRATRTYRKTDNFTVEFNTNSLTVVSGSSALKIELGKDAVFYYSQDRGNLLVGPYYYGEAEKEFGVKATLDNAEFEIPYSAMSGTHYKVYNKLDGSNVSMNLADSELAKVDAGETLYIQAETTIKDKKISSNYVSVPVKKVPVAVEAKYNFFSVQGEDLEVSPEIKKDTYLAVNSDVSEKTGTGYIWVGIDSDDFRKNAISSDKISANFALVDKDTPATSESSTTSEVLYVPYDYTLTGLSLTSGASKNYEITRSGNYGGFGYFVLPKFSVDFKALATEETVSKNKAVSSDAAEHIDAIKADHRNSNYDPSEDEYKMSTTIALPATTSLDSKTKVLDKWFEGHNRVVGSKTYAPGNNATINQDTTFYASYINKSAGEDPDSHGSIWIEDIEPVNFTGFKHTSNLNYLANNYGEAWNWYYGNTAGGKYYQKNYTKSKNTKDVKLVITSPSENRTLVEGLDYKVSYKNNINAYEYNEKLDAAKNLKKTPRVEITYIGDYKGKAKDTIYFHINPLDLSSAAGKAAYYENMKATSYAAGTKGQQKYSAVKVNVKKTSNAEANNYKAKTLKAGKDYYLGIRSVSSSALKFSNNKNDMKEKLSTVGWYNVYVYGTGNYSGKVLVKDNENFGGSFFGYDKSTFKSAKKLKMSLDTKKIDWTATPKYPVVTIKDGSKSVSADKNGGESKSNFVTYSIDNLNWAGKQTVKVTMVPSFENPYYGEKELKYTVNAKPLPAITTKTLSYNGQSVTGRYDDSISVSGLKRNEKYSCGLTKNYDHYSYPGSYKVKITGMQEYGGKTKTVTVKIDKLAIKAADFKIEIDGKYVDLSNATALSKNYHSGGVGLLEGETIRRFFNGNNGTLLTDDAFTTYSYKNNKKAGTATMIIKPVSKYATIEGKKVERTYTINPFDLKNATVYYRRLSVSAPDYEKIMKNEKSIAKYGVVDVWANGDQLKYGKDFEFTKPSGSANQIEVKAKGNNYKGSGKSAVVNKELKGLVSQINKIVISGDSTYTYDGKVKNPQVKAYIKSGSTEIEVPFDQLHLTYYKKGSPFDKGVTYNDYSDTENVNATYKGTVSIKVSGIGAPGDGSGDYGDHMLTSKKTVSFKIK